MTDTRFEKLEAVTLSAGLDPDVLALSLERLVTRGLLVRAPGGLTAAEVEFLDKHSGTTADPNALFDAQLATAVAESEQEATALTTDKVAEMLGGVTGGRVRQIMDGGGLYALPSSKGRGTTLLFPTWQFSDGKPIPHVGEVAAALGEATHPLSVRAFFLNGRIEYGEEGSMTVADWLLSGGSPEPVMGLVEVEVRGI